MIVLGGGEIDKAQSEIWENMIKWIDSFTALVKSAIDYSVRLGTVRHRKVKSSNHGPNNLTSIFC